MILIGRGLDLEEGRFERREAKRRSGNVEASEERSGAVVRRSGAERLDLCGFEGASGEAEGKGRNRGQAKEAGPEGRRDPKRGPDDPIFPVTIA